MCLECQAEEQRQREQDHEAALKLDAAPRLIAYAGTRDRVTRLAREWARRHNERRAGLVGDGQGMQPEREQSTARMRRDVERMVTVLTVSQRGDVAVNATATRDELARALLVLVRDRARLTYPVAVAYTVEVDAT